MTTTRDANWFEGRRAVVTGCASGIGHATAVQLKERGAFVIGMDIQPCTEFDEFHRIDLGDSQSIRDVAEAIDAPIDALINVAGVSSGFGGPLTVVGINFIGTRELTEALMPQLLPGSAIVNTSSLAAKEYRSRTSVTAELLATATRDEALAWCAAHPEQVELGYSLSKEAIILYTAAQAVRLAARGVRINCIAPGVTQTPILHDTISRLGEDYLNAIPKPLGRLSTPDEQASVLLFLASDAASYITGSTIWTDGGYTAGEETGTLQAFVAQR
ncbi:coniferyl-alcohol dehydrogenase [Arthrobacter sp. D1-29]